MGITIVITVGVIVCVAIICYAYVKTSDDSIKITKLKNMSLAQYQIKKNMDIDAFKVVLNEIYTVLYK